MKEIKRIDAKVKKQLKMLDEHETMRDSHFQGKLDEENARKKPRIGDLAYINADLDNSKRITEAARIMMEFTTEWNKVKAKVDAASEFDGTKYSSKVETAKLFDKHLKELQSIKPKELFKLCSRVKIIRTWRKFDTPLRSDLLSQYEFMKRVYKNAPKHLKRMRMTHNRREGYESSAASMRMNWGSF